jgi:hypothetical protein
VVGNPSLTGIMEGLRVTRQAPGFGDGGIHSPLHRSVVGHVHFQHVNGQRILFRPLRASVSANSLPKPVLEPVMRTTCLEFMIVPPHGTTVNRFDAGSKAGYKK